MKSKKILYISGIVTLCIIVGLGCKICCKLWNERYFQVEYTGNEAKIVGWSELGKKQKRVVIPAKIDGKQMVSIEKLMWNDEIEEVVISEGITIIESSALAWCDNLKEIDIPASIKIIEIGAFDGTKWEIEQLNRQDEIVVNHILVTVGDFSREQYVMPSDVNVINEGVGQNLLNIKKFVISDSVTKILENAFFAQGNLTEVFIPKSVEFIGSGAFGYCTNIENLNIPDSVQEIGEGAFSEVKHITYHGKAQGAPWGALSMN